jgi:hypothetical protein
LLSLLLLVLNFGFRIGFGWFWFASYLTCRKQARIAEFVDGEKERYKHQQEAQKQKDRSEKTQLITQKYQSQRDALKEKYGSK